MWIISGPSGSGKTSICNGLLADPAWKKRIFRSVSYTTRPLRPQEKDGRDYIHVTEPQFERMERSGSFLENEKIFGFRYGTSRSMLNDARKQNKDLLLCIDVKGAQTVRKNLGKEKVCSIFLLTPELKALSQRLKDRCTEGKKDIEKRLRRVKIELSYIKKYDYVVVNDRLEDALNKVKSILTAKRCEVQ